jgi:hypothetical protein
VMVAISAIIFECLAEFSLTQVDCRSKVRFSYPMKQDRAMDASCVL